MNKEDLMIFPVIIIIVMFCAFLLCNGQSYFLKQINNKNYQEKIYFTEVQIARDVLSELTEIKSILQEMKQEK